MVFFRCWYRVARDSFHLFDVDVRVVESVEEYQSFSACFCKAERHAADIGEVVAEFYRDRDVDVFLNIFKDIDIFFFNFSWVEVSVESGDGYVKFDGVGACILKFSCDAGPFAVGWTVDTRNDRDVDALLRFTN